MLARERIANSVPPAIQAADDVNMSNNMMMEEEKKEDVIMTGNERH